MTMIMNVLFGLVLVVSIVAGIGFLLAPEVEFEDIFANVKNSFDEHVSL